MSGSYFSSGNMFNKGETGLNKEDYYNLTIIGATLYKFCLTKNRLLNQLGTFPNAISFYLPFINFPKYSHFALQLTTFDNRIIIIEYGNYLNINSEKESTGMSGSSSNNKCKGSEDNNLYYYLLKDGARFQEIKNDEIKDEKSIYNIIKANYFGVPLKDIQNFRYFFIDFLEKEEDNVIISSPFKGVQLNIGNKITLGELISSLIKGNNWNAKDYNVAFNNCQDFVAKCIRLLILTRPVKYKLRLYETTYFSPCILKAFYDVEGWSVGNTFKRLFQRIPLIGNFIPSS